ncbi:MAG: 16S rRNA (uracil(1498)-N(3))-methyltransferase [Candidatus Omnitrophica bacterium]|nr:16S rRNA (uracil(1498)-N(3))-methyltransferase [Candidatus Omnitrophota bacterium]
MRRFFADSKNVSAGNIIINDKEQIHHIKDVLRLVPGDEVVIFDDNGREYSSIVEEILLTKVSFKVKENKKQVLPKEPQLVIACAIPKGPKMDDIIDKLSQLGVDRVIPLLTERVVVKLDERKKISRQVRWKKIALSSAKQSQRNNIMAVGPVSDIGEALSSCKSFDLKLIPNLAGKRQSLKEVFNKGEPKNILVFIGPEGDFSPREIELAQKSGCIPVSLGSLVLRVDTAAISVASFIKLYAHH